MSIDPSKAKSIFLAATEKPATERGPFLDQACGDDAELRRRVEELLAAHNQGRGTADAPAGAEPTSDPNTEPSDLPPKPSGSRQSASNDGGEQPGTRIGQYKLLQKIADGGMGSVWMAEQTAPVKRTVALKLIKPGMDSGQILARFEAERQALAMMDHPNIAKVLDAGTTDKGRPFFVMELVKGIPITKYCDDHRLAPKERLELFVQVCNGIQHAHQKGIIHRDIKPNNVLVARFDDKAVPKVIDFGVAKATGEKLTERTMFTGFGGFVGTLEYMSPEQAQFNQLDIDTRSDIYALGILLYELLTGTTPLTRNRLKQAALTEVLRLIREEEPPKPSTRLSSSEALPSLSATRKMEPAKLTKWMRGEPDWIVMKSLEKDRTRRYETANAFALDVQRYLHDEPVVAGPPSATYRMRKFAKRNKGPLVAAALVLLALVGGMLGTTLGLVEAQRQRDDAEQARLNEAEQRQAAVAQRDRAVTAEKDARFSEFRAKEEENKAKSSELRAKEEEENAKANARKAQEEESKAKASEHKALAKEAEARQSAADALAVLRFFQDSVLSAARPMGQAGGLGINATIRAAVNRAEPRIDKAFRDNPLVEASIRDVLGTTYWYLGQATFAIQQYERSLGLRAAKLGPEHPDTLTTMNNLAMAYQNAGRLSEALSLLEESLKLRKAKLGAEHPDTLHSMNNLAFAHRAAGRLDDALALFEESLKLRKAQLGAEHPDTLASMNNLAMTYRDAGRLNDALPLLEESLKLYKATLGAEHPDTVTIMNNLALAYRDAGRLNDALPLFEESLKLYKATLGAEHPNMLNSMNNLASAYRAAGRLNEALPLFEEALKLLKAKLGAEHPGTLNTMNNLALAYRAAGRLSEALPLLEESLKLRKAKLGAEHHDTVTIMNNLALAYRAAGRLNEALPLFEEALKLRKAKLGAEHPDTLTSMNNLALAYRAAGRLSEALPLLEETLKLSNAKRGAEHPTTLTSMNNLALAYQDAGRLNAALPLFEEALKLRKAKLGAEHPNTLNSMNNLASAYQAGGQLNDAESLLRDCLSMRERQQPDDWTTFNTKSMLGGSLLGQKKYADAEPLLLQGYEGMKQRADKMPAAGQIRLTEAVERIVQLYEATEQPELAAKWRMELENTKAKDKKKR